MLILDREIRLSTVPNDIVELDTAHRVYPELELIFVALRIRFDDLEQELIAKVSSCGEMPTKSFLC